MLMIRIFVSAFLLKGGFPRGEIIGEFATKKISYSDWLKMFGENFRHEKVEMILPHFANKIKTNEIAHAQ